MYEHFPSFRPCTALLKSIHLGTQGALGRWKTEKAKKKKKKRNANWYKYIPPVSVKGGLTLRNGVWHDLRNGIVYAEYDVCGMTSWHKLSIHSRSQPSRFLVSRWRSLEQQYCQINAKRKYNYKSIPWIMSVFHNVLSWFRSSSQPSLAWAVWYCLHERIPHKCKLRSQKN